MPASLAGLPALSTPSAVWENDHPTGVQLISRPFADGLLLRVAHHLEQTGTRLPLPKPVAALLQKEVL